MKLITFPTRKSNASSNQKKDITFRFTLETNYSDKHFSLFYAVCWDTSRIFVFLFSWDVNETRVRIYSFGLKSCFIMYERSKRNTVRRAGRRFIFNAVSEGHKIHYKLLLASTVKTVQQIMLCILNREKFLRCAIVFIQSTKERDRKRGHFSL